MSSQCRTASLRFLKIRPRSVREIRDKLQGKGFTPAEVEEEIEYLKSIDLLDDRAFTASWIRYRLARPFGFRRIVGELKEKGVAEDIIADAVSSAKGEYSEYDTILELAQRRAERLVGIDPQKRKKRVGDFLLRRGFAIDIVMKVLKKI